MRCPYCGGLNSDRASFCVECGRDISVKAPSIQAPPSRQQPSQQPVRPTYQPPQPPSSPDVPPGGRPARPLVPPTTPQKAPGAQQTRLPQSSTPSSVPPYTSQQVPASSQLSQAPEPPAPFPPRTMAQLKQLEQGALPYTVVSDTIDTGHKKLLLITFPRCAPWQQVATLLKAFRDNPVEKANTVIVQGFQPQDREAYRYTNGQLYFDRNVRLGSETQNRYQIETGNGFSSDSVRIVLSE